VTASQERSRKGLLTNKTLDSDQTFPETRQRIANLIRFWREFATAFHEAAGAGGGLHEAAVTEGGEAENITLDPARAVMRVRSQIDKVDAYLALVERDLQSTSLANVHLLLEAALLFASGVHQLTIVENETAIATMLAKVQALNEINAVRSERLNQRLQQWQPRANEIWCRHPDWPKTAVAKEIARYDRSANHNTIRRQIKKPKIVVTALGDDSNGGTFS
jgi:hypothetical protein